jgi:hypothetical protein
MYFQLSDLFLVELLLAVVASVFYFWIAARVRQAGGCVKIFSTPRDALKMFREYRGLAAGRGWPAWPVYGFWIALAGLFAAGIAGAVGFGGK